MKFYNYFFALSLIGILVNSAKAQTTINGQPASLTREMFDSIKEQGNRLIHDYYSEIEYALCNDSTTRRGPIFDSVVKKYFYHDPMTHKATNNVMCNDMPNCYCRVKKTFPFIKKKEVPATIKNVDEYRKAIAENYGYFPSLNCYIRIYDSIVNITSLRYDSSLNLFRYTTEVHLSYNLRGYEFQENEKRKRPLFPKTYGSRVFVEFVFRNNFIFDSLNISQNKLEIFKTDTIPTADTIPYQFTTENYAQKNATLMNKKYGSIVINSFQPNDISVSIQDVKNPLHFIRSVFYINGGSLYMKPGTYKFSFSKKNYKAEDTAIKIAAGEAYTFNEKLVQKKVKLVVVDDAGLDSVRLSIDGIRKGPIPLNENDCYLSSGAHYINEAMAGYIPRRVNFELNEDKLVDTFYTKRLISEVIYTVFGAVVSTFGISHSQLGKVVRNKQIRSAFELSNNNSIENQSVERKSEKKAARFVSPIDKHTKERNEQQKKENENKESKKGKAANEDNGQKKRK